MLCEDMQESRINSIYIDTNLRGAAGTLAHRDREIALRDLEQGSVFQPHQDESGPYDIQLSIEESRLVFRIQNSKADELSILVLSLKPYKRLIQDYFLIVSSYDDAIKDGKPSRIEAIDMGRRGVHNEGAEMLMERLSDKIKMDINTARRLFTLICVLHEGKALLFC